MAHIEKNTIIRAPVAEVSALAVDPHRWHAWFSGLSEPERIDGTGEAGTVVKHSYLLAGMRVPVTTRVLVAEFTETGHHWEATIEGPFDGKQSWTYTTVPEGTRVTVVMDYVVPGSVLGKFVDRMFIERMQERSMEQTLDNLKLLVESMPVVP